MFEDVEEIRKDGEQPVHFYYNREERLAHAPQNVKDFYAGKMKTPRGLRVLFNKQNRFVLFGLLLVVGFGLGYSGLSKTKAYSTIADVNAELSAFAYEEEIFASIKLKRNPKSEDINPKLIEADIKVIEPNNQINEKQHVSIMYEDGEQFLRAKFTDFDIIRVEADLFYGEEKKFVSCEVKR